MEQEQRLHPGPVLPLPPTPMATESRVVAGAAGRAGDRPGTAEAAGAAELGIFN